jgi:integrase
MKTLDVMGKYLSQHVLRPNTIQKYRDIFNYLNEFSPEFPTSSGIINEWIVWLRNTKKLADITTHRHYTMMRSVANYMNYQYDIPNAFLKSKRPTFTKKPRRYFTAQELARIISSCRTDIERAIVMTCIDSGCRIEDLSGLKASQISTHGFTTSTDKKTGSHTYRLDPHMCNALKALAGSENGYVFCSNTFGGKLIPDKPASPNALAGRVRNILIRAGFKGSKLGAHTFRHSVGSLIAKSTKSALAVKGILGHADINTSMIYIHDAEQEAAQEISPLQLISDQVFTNESNNPNVIQSHLISDGKSTALIPTLPSESNPTDILREQSYPIPPKDTIIRARFTFDDLMLIRRLIFCMYNTDHVPDDEAYTNKLWHRMLRRTKLDSNFIPDSDNPESEENKQELIQ